MLEIGELEDFEDEQKYHNWFGREAHVVGRIYAVSLIEEEMYNLQALLLHVSDAKWYEDVCPVHGKVFSTLRVAAGIED